MFDFGFSELLLIALVGLIVVGPQRLPKVARTVGHMLGRLQRYVSDVKSDIQREMQLEDLKKLQQEVEQQARDLESSVRSQMSQVQTDLNKTADEVRDSVNPDRAPTSPAQPSAGSPATALPAGGEEGGRPAPVSDATAAPVFPVADAFGGKGVPADEREAVPAASPTQPSASTPGEKT